MEATAPPISLTEVTGEVVSPPTVEEVKTQIAQEVGALIAWVLGCQTLTFFAFEVELIPKVLALGRLFVQLFLCMREAQFQAAHPQPGARVSTARAQRPVVGDILWEGALLAYLLLPRQRRVLPPGH